MKTASLPIVTPCSLVPISAPHIQKGRLEQHGVGFGDLRDLDPGALQPRAGRMRPPRLPVEELRLVRIAVRVLGEQHPVGSRRWPVVSHIEAQPRANEHGLRARGHTNPTRRDGRSRTTHAPAGRRRNNPCAGGPSSHYPEASDGLPPAVTSPPSRVVGGLAAFPALDTAPPTIYNRFLLTGCRPPCPPTRKTAPGRGPLRPAGLPYPPGNLRGST